MGTLLQELGHDIVLVNFVDKVLKRKIDNMLYLVCPAIGPKIDLHFLNNAKGEYVSAYNISPKDYIPEFSFRVNFPREILERLDILSNYRSSDWYKMLSGRLENDVKDLVAEILTSIGKENVDFPDAIGISGERRETVWVEVKFEGLGKKACETAIRQSSVAEKRGVPFVLVIPEKPAYGKRLTTANILKKAPENLQLYTFSTPHNGIPPKRNDMVFIQARTLPDR